MVHDPEAIEILFDTIALQAVGDARRARHDDPVGLHRLGAVAPAHRQRLDGRRQGRAPHADITLRCSLDDWADVVSGREDPRKLMLKRRIKPRGDLRLLLKLPKVFG